MTTCTARCFPLLFACCIGLLGSARGAEANLLVGFAETEITPDVNGERPVWIAGYGHGRMATGVHDPLMVRCVVLGHGADRIALVAVDLVGLQYPEVQRIRQALRDYRYVLVASTHNHEGPDVIGIWGPTPFQRGVDGSYLQLVVDRSVQTVRTAEKKLEPARADYGTVSDESLLRDSREPYVKDPVLRVLRFSREDGQTIGILTQFSCHPESLGSRNTLLTADFPHATVARLRERHGCAVVYFSGAVGGLMSNPSEPVRDPQGREHHDGTFEYAQIYGAAVADALTKAVQNSRPVRLVPFSVSAKPIAIPIENKLYRAARELGVLQRTGLAWTGDSEVLAPLSAAPKLDAPVAVETEVGYLRLGEVHVAAIPGELYPELVYGRVQDPVDAGADFPDAPVEPPISQTIPGDKWLVIGLANDEIGYIIPKRQWDERPPFCYGRMKSQYGEINSCGPNVGPLIMQALANRVREAPFAR
jgi:hypothetical protein